MESKSISKLHQEENPSNDESDQNKSKMGLTSNQRFSSNLHYFQTSTDVLCSELISSSVFTPLTGNHQIETPGTPLMGNHHNGFHPFRLVNSTKVQKPRSFGVSSVTKAARSKRKLVRQRSLTSSRVRFLCNQSSSSGSSSSSSSILSLATGITSNNNGGDKDIYSLPTPDDKRLKFLLQKELRNSDVNSLGRIIIPKKNAEANLPSLKVKEGIKIPIREVESAKMWFMRYRFWPNNKSRMYVLENTGEFVKENKLKSGDIVMLYQDEHKQLYISSKKAEKSSLSIETEKVEVPELPNDMKQNEDLRMITSIETNIKQEWIVDEPSSSSNDLVTEGDHLVFDGSMFLNFSGCDLSELELLSNFDDCDLSLYDDLVKDFIADDKSHTSSSATTSK